MPPIKDYLIKIIKTLLSEKLSSSQFNHIQISFYEILGMVSYSSTYTYTYFRAVCEHLGGNYERGKCIFTRAIAEKILRGEGVTPE
jgi:hypothetical protein